MKVLGKPGRRLAFEDESCPEAGQKAGGGRPWEAGKEAGGGDESPPVAVDTARTLDPCLAAGVWHRRPAILDHSRETGAAGLEALHMLFKPMVIS